MSVRGAGERIRTVVSALPDVSAHPHRFGGTEYRLGKRELGHTHGDSLVDLPFPTRIRDELVADGRAEPHHIMPESGWVSLHLRAEADVERAIELFKRSYELARQKWQSGVSSEVADV